MELCYEYCRMSFSRSTIFPWRLIRPEKWWLKNFVSTKMDILDYNILYWSPWIQQWFCCQYDNFVVINSNTVTVSCDPCALRQSYRICKFKIFYPQSIFKIIVEDNCDCKLIIISMCKFPLKLIKSSEICKLFCQIKFLM